MTESTPESEILQPFRWTQQRDRAALLLAEDDRNDKEIAGEIGVVPSTLYRWKEHPHFQQRIADYAAELNAATRRYRIAKRRHRVRVLDDLHTKALAVIEHRANRNQERLGSDDPAVIAAQAARDVIGDFVPGEAITGLLVEKENVNNTGIKSVEWAVDTGLVRMIESLHERAESELGQKVERTEINQTLAIHLVGVDPEAI